MCSPDSFPQLQDPCVPAGTGKGRVVFCSNALAPSNDTALNIGGPGSLLQPVLPCWCCLVLCSQLFWSLWLGSPFSTCSAPNPHLSSPLVLQFPRVQTSGRQQEEFVAVHCSAR